jgi:Flp pilus assembly protein TadG
MFERIRTKLAIHGKRMLWAATIRHLIKREDGATAVEFGMLALPFFALMFAIIETALVFFAGQTLETATADASRLIMTGQAQTQGFDQVKFKESVCSRIYGLFDCANGVKIDVRTAASFSAADLSKPLDANGNLTTNFAYSPGNAGDIVIVRVMYQWPIHIARLSNMAGGKRLLMATAAFRNEPYQ